MLSPRRLAIFAGNAAALHKGGGVFNVSGLPIWSAAVQAYQAGGPAPMIGLVGDSIFRGTTAVASNVQNGPARWLADKITERYPALKTRHDSLYGISNSGMSYFLSVTPTITASTDWTASVSTSLGGAILLNNTANSVNPLTMNPGTFWDQVEIAYKMNTSAEAFTVDIGGAVLATINAAAGANAYGRTTVTVPRGQNALSIRRLGATSKQVEPAHIRYIDTQNPAIDVLNMGGFGWRVGEYATTTAPWSPGNAIALETGVKLWFIQLGTNDANQPTATTEAAFKASYQVIIDKCRLAGGDVVCQVPPPWDGTYIARQATFRQYILDVAATNGLPVVDMMQRWGTVAMAASNGFMQVGDLHPLALGYQDMGLAMSQVILPPV